MPEWLSVQYLQYGWVPVLGALLTWLAARQNGQRDSRTAEWVRINARQEMVFKQVEEEREELRTALSAERITSRRWENIATGWWRHSRNLSFEIMALKQRCRAVLFEAKHPVPTELSAPDPPLPPLESPPNGG